MITCVDWKNTTGRTLIQPDPDHRTAEDLPLHEVKVLSDAELPNRTVSTSGATKGDYYPVYVGDFKAFMTLFRGKNLEVASTNIGGNAWATDSTEVRGLMRMDCVKMDGRGSGKERNFCCGSILIMGIRNGRRNITGRSV